MPRKTHHIEHCGWCYDFDDLEDLKRRLRLIPIDSYDDAHPASLNSGGIRKAAKCLGMKPSELLRELIAAGMPTVLSPEEMIGRKSSFDIGVFTEFVGRGRDSIGSCGYWFKVTYASGEVHDCFVHANDMNDYWYKL